MITITTTAESVEQAKALIDAGADTLYIGEAEFGLRVPTALTYDEIREITLLAHEAGRTVTVAVNSLMHTEDMAKIKPFLDFLQEIGVDKIAVGDTGVIFVLQRDGYKLPYIYDASTLVASARQINFWAEQGAVEAVLARELPKIELEGMASEMQIPGEILVYGATVIHQSKRPLIQNFYNFIKTDETGKDRERHLFVSEPKKEDTHYSIFEDNHGTHIFANDDLDMLTELSNLTEMGYNHWKLDGIFTRGEVFVKIVKIFVEAKKLIEAGNFTIDKANQLDEEVRKLHPSGRTVSHGFYDINPEKIK
ncbi:peptidase U32 family protein [Lactococcus nasutitermitis]|uniref:Peptidase U32 family protein n=1 Tax=Lactococcus nasutitermitis TaxID=1652957 RepID=A0ABV9JBJ8_9LACT|nr:peptidase U32 family protein [Lactococcus nasutitermitis]